MDTTPHDAARRIDPFAPLRALWSARTWRALAHLFTGGPIGYFGGLGLLILGAIVILGSFTIVLPLLGGALIVKYTEALAAVQRSRHSAFLDLRLPGDRPKAPFTLRPRELLALLGTRRLWHRLAYHLVAMCYGSLAAALSLAVWVAGAVLLAVPLYWADRGDNLTLLCLIGFGLLLAAPWVTRGLAALDAQLARLMLGPIRSEELERRIGDLAASRESTVDAERRRIERDLHDGAQQRITALAMNLGIARATLTDVPEPSARALEQAHEEAKQALVELRDLVRGLHPAVLEDRGLDAALSAVAARSPVPVRLHVDMDRRAGRDIEAVAYFVVSEALTNVARHSGASRASVDVVLRGDTLHLTVTDDGTGGADPDGGTGLRGLAGRVRSVEGTFALTSPAGGPPP